MAPWKGYKMVKSDVTAFDKLQFYQSFPCVVLTYHFSFWAPKVKIKVAYSIVGRHFEFLIGVSVEHGAPGWIYWLPRHSEALLIVQGQTNILSVQRATWKRERQTKELKNSRCMGEWRVSNVPVGECKSE